MNQTDQLMALYLLDTAIEQINEMVGYVPQYFREKWEYDEQLSLLQERRNELKA